MSAAVPIQQFRNIGIVAHIDAGKTTTTERILYYTGASHKMGDVDEGTTQTDFDPEEAKRGITIYSAAVTCQWTDKQRQNTCRINLIDTPGHVDFTAEVERSLRVLDGAIVVFSAVEGVEAQSETVWRQANRYHVPRLCFINKLDRIGAGFERTFNTIARRLQAQPVAVTIPIGESDKFKGIIDLIEMRALYFDSASKGEKIDVQEIPEDLQIEAEDWRSKLLDAVSLVDDEVMQTYMDSGEVPPELIIRALRAATLAGAVQPTFCGSSLDYCGVQPLLDGVNRYLPSPIEVPPVTGINPSPKKNQPPEETRKPDPDEPFAGLIFKIVADKHADLCFVRVYSGTLKSGSRMLNPRTGKKELISQLWHIQADQREKLETDQVSAGDIVGVIGPKEVVTGDTLCDQRQQIVLESITFPETVISMAVEPDSSADRKKLEDALLKLAKQDPTFKAKVSEETGQTIISGMGELHLEIIRERLVRDYSLNVRVHKPRVSYRETVKTAGTGTGEFQRAVQGVSQFARVGVRVEPFQGETPVIVKWDLKHGEVPLEVQKIIVESVAEAAQSGGLFGYPLMHVRCIINDVGYREGESTEEALRAAAAQSVQDALGHAEAALLEPIMKLEVVTPADFVGPIQADLNQRHARIVGSEHRGDLTALTADVALARMFGYSTHVRSLSQGRASYSMEPLKYDLAPPSVLQEMMG
ncbi:MAG: elongation factor G [Planctomycetaceae bacterium]|nr:elongation factor G [Planctomycetaceae bacterium]